MIRRISFSTNIRAGKLSKIPVSFLSRQSNRFQSTLKAPVVENPIATKRGRGRPKKVIENLQKIAAIKEAVAEVAAFEEIAAVKEAVVVEEPVVQAITQRWEQLKTPEK